LESNRSRVKKKKKEEEEEELRAVSIEPFSLRDMAKKTNAVEHLWSN